MQEQRHARARKHGETEKSTAETKAGTSKVERSSSSIGIATGSQDTTSPAMSRHERPSKRHLHLPPVDPSPSDLPFREDYSQPVTRDQ